MFEIGPALREARERRGLAYNQVEAATAIRSRYLRALEDEQFSILPGPTYAKGFLRAYAEYLGLDGQLFIDEFNSRHHDARRDWEQPIYSRPRSQPPHRRRARRESNLVMITLAAIVAVASLIFIASTFPHQQAPPITTTNPPPGTGSGTGTTPPPSTGTTTAGTGTHTTRPTRFTLVLSVTNRCWVVLRVGSPTGPEAVSTQGTSLGGYTIDPAVASSITVVSRKPLYLSQIGAASSLTLSIDGHTTALPSGTTSSSVLRVTRTGVTPA